MSTQQNYKEEVQTILETLNPQRGNLVLSFLLDRLHLDLPGVVITAFVFLSLLTILLNLLQKTFWPCSPEFTALFSFKFATHLINVPILAPAIAGVAVVIYREIPLMFRELINSGVLVVPNDKMSFFDNLQKRYQSRVVNTIIVISLVIFAIVWALITLRQDFSNWLHKEPHHITIAGWYWIVILTVAIYVIIHVAISIFFTYGAIRTMFADKSRFKISLKFMHPDRCCGFRPLNKFVMKVGLFLALLAVATGTHIVCSIYRYPTVEELLSQVGQPLCVVAYIIFAPLVFFLPLLPAHRVMKNAKDKFQMDISHEFDRLFGQPVNLAKTGHINDLEYSQLEILCKCQQCVDSFPVWPFNTGMLARFASLVLLPLALFVIEICIQIWLI